MSAPRRHRIPAGRPSAPGRWATARRVALGLILPLSLAACSIDVASLPGGGTGGGGSGGGIGGGTSDPEAGKLSSNGLALDFDTLAAFDPTRPLAHWDAATSTIADAATGDAAALAPVLSRGDGLEHLAYLSLCALDRGTELAVTDPADGSTVHFPGLYGLAPGWVDGTCDQGCQRWVSACLLAHANAFGDSVMISMRGDNPGIVWDSTIETDYPLQEGAFYGNAFAAPNPLGQRPVFACLGRALILVRLGRRRGSHQPRLPHPTHLLDRRALRPGRGRPLPSRRCPGQLLRRRRRTEGLLRRLPRRPRRRPLEHGDGLPRGRHHLSREPMNDGPPSSLHGDTPHTPETLLGSTAGAFHLDQVMAEGGFGTIYRASGGPRGLAAVKVLHAELAGSAEAVARFQREIDVLARLDHPGLVEILAVGRLTDGRPYFAMELLEGRDLERHILGRGRLTPAEALSVLSPVCEALAAAHDAGVIHRDVKASNVFLAEDGRVVLLDFGIAKLTGTAAADAAGLTVSRQALGTPSAMAPEQIAGRAATPRTDVYALGALVYHMVTGEPPFADASPTVMQYLHAHARRPAPTARAPLPPASDAFIASAMAIEPDRRPSDPRALLSAARAALGEGQAADRQERCSRPALSVALEVRVHADGLPDDDDLAVALDDADAVWSAARAHFCAHGFTPALETSESILFVRPLANQPVAREPDPVAAFERLIATRPGRHPQVAIQLHTTTGPVQFAAGRPLAPPSLSAARPPQPGAPR